MSRFTGKCDLYDEVYMIGSAGVPDGASESEKFEAFRKETGGVIYQPVQAEVTARNEAMLERELCGKLRRAPDGNARHYSYLGRTYRSLKSLNRDGGVWLNRPVRFSTMMELLPYYGHTVSAMYASEGTKAVFISSMDCSLSEDLDAARYGIDTGFRRSSETASMLAEEACRVAETYGGGLSGKDPSEKESGDYPYARHLDGTYVEVPRNGRTESVCLTDLTRGELGRFLSSCGPDRLRGVCLQLAKDLRRAGDCYSLEAGDDGD